MPAVVNVDVLISHLAQARFHHSIGHCADDLLVDVASKLVPSAPTHLWAIAYLFPFLRPERQKCHQADNDDCEFLHSFRSFQEII